MIVTISQPRYLPWLGYLHKMAASDVFMYLDTVQYTPRDWENRNKIKTDRGWTWLTVPVKAKYRALIPEVLVDNEQAWGHKHWHTIRTYYGSAPFFELYAERFRSLFEETWQQLTDLNLALTSVLCDCFGLKRARVVRASEYPCSGQGTELLVQLCQAVGGTTYFSGSQGRNYLDETAFARAGIEVVYQDYKHPEYPQLYGPFELAMAAIDLLFNCGPASADILLRDQESMYAVKVKAA
jgi:hypothetical protein